MRFNRAILSCWVVAQTGCDGEKKDDSPWIAMVETSSPRPASQDLGRFVLVRAEGHKHNAQVRLTVERGKFLEPTECGTKSECCLAATENGLVVTVGCDDVECVVQGELVKDEANECGTEVLAGAIPVVITQTATNAASEPAEAQGEEAGS